MKFTPSSVPTCSTPLPDSLVARDTRGAPGGGLPVVVDVVVVVEVGVVLVLDDVVDVGVVLVLDDVVVVVPHPIASRYRVV